MFRSIFFTITTLCLTGASATLAQDNTQLEIAQRIKALSTSKQINVQLVESVPVAPGEDETVQSFQQLFDRKHVMEVNGCTATISVTPVWLSDDMYEYKAEFDLSLTNLQTIKPNNFFYKENHSGYEGNSADAIFTTILPYKAKNTQRAVNFDFDFSSLDNSIQPYLDGLEGDNFATGKSHRILFQMYELADKTKPIEFFDVLLKYQATYCPLQN